MVKAAFFDIDGTLLSHTMKKVPEGNREAVRLLREKGILVFIATGRHLLEIKYLPVSDIEVDGYLTLNGQICMDSQENILYSEPIHAEDTKTLLTWFEEKKYSIQAVEKERMYVNFVNEKIRSAQKDISTPIPPVEEVNGEPIYQFVLYVDDEEIEEVKAGLKHSDITRWNQYGIDIGTKNLGKSAGIREMLKKLGLTKEEIIAFGDGENDMDMLKYAGIGVAMGNADEKVKAVSDYVTDSVDDDGILKALKHFSIL